MDDDVQTDNGILYNAKGTCWTDISEMYYQVMRKQISGMPHNKEMLLRIKFPAQYSRGGRFQEAEDYSLSSKQSLSTQMYLDIQKNRRRRFNSISKYEVWKIEQTRCTLGRDEDSDLLDLN